MCDRPKENVVWNKKKLVSSTARSNPVNCDFSLNRFNSHFINITKNLDSSLKKSLVHFSGKARRVSMFLNFIIYLSKISNSIFNDQ